MSYHNIPASAVQRLTNAQGQTAPAGYHYMPDGSLMSDADHAARYANSKVLKSFILDTSNIKIIGERRRFTITGDGIFSLEIKDESNNYYNFVTNKFQSTKARLGNKTVFDTYSGNIAFPAAIPTTDTVNGAVSSGVKVVMDTVVANTMQVGDKITGNAFLDANDVTVAALNPDGDNTSEFSLSTAVAISDGITLSFTGSNQYDIFLFSEQGTKHADYNEVRLADGSLDINSSTGSNSNLLQKVIYQTLDVRLILSASSPNAVTVFAGATPTTKIITTQTGKSIAKTPFSISVSAGATHSFRIDKTPDISDTFVFVTRNITSATAIPGENIYPAVSDTDTVNGTITEGIKVVMDNNVADNLVVGDKITAPINQDTVSGDVTSGVKVLMANPVAGKMSVGDQVTSASAGLLNTKLITVVELNPDGDNVREFSLSSAVPLLEDETLTFTPKCNRSLTTVAALNPDSDNVKEFSMSQEIALLDGAALSFSNQMNFSWGLDNIDGIVSGMLPLSGNLTSGTLISPYEEAVIVAQGTAQETKIIKKSVKAVYGAAAKPTITRDSATKALSYTQTGSVTFSKQQKLVLTGDGVKVLGRGPSQISSLTGWDIELSDVIVTVTKPTAVTTSAVSASTSVPIDNADGVMDDVSTVSSINMNAAVVDPTVTTIGSYSGASATLTLSAAQTLEDGETLTFNGAGRIITISGNVEIKKVGQIRSDWTGSLFFDLERFITATDES